MSDTITSRILTLSTTENNGRAVVYVMARDQRVRDNHALLLAQKDALEHDAPLLVLFNLLSSTSNRSREQYEFMLAGLKEVAHELETRNIPFVMRTGTSAGATTLDFLKEVSAASVYFDFSPLRGPRSVAKRVAKGFDGQSYVVDTHNIIPVWITSDKQEFAAHTIRRKVHTRLAQYLEPVPSIDTHSHTFGQAIARLSQKEIDQLVQDVPPSGSKPDHTPGENAAQKTIDGFIQSRLSTYARDRNNPTKDGLSGFSPYLHFGQVSSLRVALSVMYAVDEPPLLLSQARMPQASGEPSEADGMNALLEEMIVRKELSDNFCFYTSDYKSLSSAPAWAQTTLAEHADDTREFTYSKDEWEAATTHDQAWNASQRQMMRTGKLHGYMRMYWAKKILEWSDSAQEALATTIYLNDKYMIDGGDPNGYVGILWAIAGLHDRPWTERQVFGKVRYMNAGGLKRKFDIQAYIDQWR